MKFDMAADELQRQRIRPFRGRHNAAARAAALDDSRHAAR